MNTRIKQLFDSLRNTLDHTSQLLYVVEPAHWSIQYDGKYITQALNQLKLVTARAALTDRGYRGAITHYGSEYTALRSILDNKPTTAKHRVLTWFHYVPDLKTNQLIIDSQSSFDRIHTSCHSTKQHLIQAGIKETSLTVIPLGVDLSIFRPAESTSKQTQRKKLGIPENACIIGSFQKDGDGWGRGDVPKLIKGPDIYIKVVEQLSKTQPIYIVLVGPARGYVINELTKRNIPYRTFGYLNDLSAVARLYNLLDLYLITSRIEGGPKQILEALATGVPVVSTKVGMVPDIINDGEDALLADVEDVDALVRHSLRIIEDSALSRKLVSSGLRKVAQFSWDRIAQRYYTEIYSTLI
ncbi:MAG: glycosyltransferase family 4 protein [Patescibacteria group bacterium]|jgi:glycosyltransferase involved in cell wall biosynthesis